MTSISPPVEHQAAAPPLGIVELVDVCARHRAISLDLFEALGALVADEQTRPGADQQLLARACHRHAWHADLWEARAPTLPNVQFEATVASHRGTLGAVTDANGYRTALAQLQLELATLATRCDPLLDPSTTRVISLVLSDLCE